MAKQWTALKNLISSEELQKNPFLTLINGEGRILCANAAMQRNLHLDNPRHASLNFFNLLHPDHIEHFRQAIEESHSAESASCAELYLKNGYYQNYQLTSGCWMSKIPNND